VSRPTPPKGDIEKLRRKEEAERTLADVEAEIDVLKYRPGKPIMIVCHRPKQGLNVERMRKQSTLTRTRSTT
jgi:hypothetical protein